MRLVKGEIETRNRFDVDCEKFCQYLKAPGATGKLLAAQSYKKVQYPKVSSFQSFIM